MKLSIIAGACILLLTACQNPYTGEPDPWLTAGAIGAGALAVGALGYAAGQNSRPQYNNYYRPAPRYYQPRRYGGHPYYR